MTAVHQFVPTLAPHDAVSTHYLAVQDALRAAGYRSEIYAHEVKPALRRRGRQLARSLPGRKNRTRTL